MPANICLPIDEPVTVVDSLEAAASRCYREALSGQSQEVAELKEKMLALQQIVSTLNGDEGRKRKRGKAQAWEKNSNIESWVHAGVRRLLGMSEMGRKVHFAPEKWPDYDGPNARLSTYLLRELLKGPEEGIMLEAD
ncbi:hypothetical protein L202_06204 [Cryptococcus amylolentus CBS 6039]|uniref:Uncharacterized protein n=1 Tax=Cryptococcus amylolentus CBS 6039 TaxID=1295533 RepID=A0A1E3HIT8_9TREE|nr:hypothetical protein L202_06204 [Cryptococcus amylolentus CBS 6039]ODN76277.1 hypothetical protein L202_06204 [Cryptococcus amylolentus CBS 6039]